MDPAGPSGVAYSLQPGSPLALPAHEKPRLQVVVDVEEEFDWRGEFSREAVSVKHMRRIFRIQSIFDEYGIRPVYAVNYPVASQPDGYLPLRDILKDQRCVIGAHLHPWVTPPYREEVSRRNSFSGNLPAVLEEEKIRATGECLEQNLGIRPRIFKAGRYGIGANTAAILARLGYEVDLSACSYIDYSKEGGPDFTGIPPWPYWFGPENKLLELPLTVGFEGLLRRFGPRCYGIATLGVLAALRLPGILCRLRLLNRVWLSPEGYASSEQRRLVRALSKDGLKVFSFSLHSPSLEPGNTPYVRSESELESFLSNCRSFFEFFLGEFGGVASTPLQIRELLAE